MEKKSIIEKLTSVRNDLQEYCACLHEKDIRSRTVLAFAIIDISEILFDITGSLAMSYSENCLSEEDLKKFELLREAKVVNPILREIK